MPTALLPLATLLLALVSAPVSAHAGAPLGRWLTQDAAAVIEIEPCGPALCGRIVGVTVDHPGDPPPVDAHGRPQCGQVIITDMQPEGTNLWRGRISDPRYDRSYRAEMWVGAQQQLRLRGYLGVPLFGATQDWSRFDQPIGSFCHMAG